MILAGLALPAHGGGKDLHPLREPPKDAAKVRAQELQKQKMLARVHADAPSRTERLAPVATLDLPIFNRRQPP